MCRRYSLPAGALVTLAAVGLLPLSSNGSEPTQAVAHFKSEIVPILEAKCYGCHGYGESEGQVSFDALADEVLVHDVGLWNRVLKNVRAGIMPPADEERPTPGEIKKLEHWIKYEAFGIDAADPDPGRVTLRRLNRNEYRHTVQDLMGYDYRADEDFPPDDTGFGFDNIADLLSLSPMLIEKYMRAADEIVHAAVPEVTKVVAETVISGAEFVRAGGGPDRDDDRVSFARAGRYPRTIRIEQPGEYRVTVEFGVYGQFDYDRGRADISFSSEGKELYRETHVWQDEKNGLVVKFDFERNWQPGEREFVFEVGPLPLPAQDEEEAWPDQAEKQPAKATTQIDLKIVGVTVEGPLDEQQWVNPPNYERFFPRPEPPRDEQERSDYARQVLRTFTDRAYRRPVDAPTLDRMVALAESVYSQPGHTFEQGIQQAMTAVLCSKRFLFRTEEPIDDQAARPFVLLDEYSLASRLSYLLWCSMPDDELFNLAERGELRKHLQAQVERMLADPKSDAFVESFVGQWLRTREVDTVDIDARVVLARDAGTEAELRAQQVAFRAAIDDGQIEPNVIKSPPKKGPPDKAQQDIAQPDKDQEPVRGRGDRPRRRGAARGQFAALFAPPAAQLDSGLRKAMRQETEDYFAYVARQNRSVLELVDSDYTFVNERLAKHYAIDDVRGEEMRKISLPEDSHRGGILTQGAVLTVTSQSTRTSPVKRGLFVLDNLLGTPAPPAPPNVPALENVEQSFDGREPTLREALEMHRREAVCATCHARMDPIGLAMENFNALGMWRTRERGQDIEVGSQLLTGEKLEGIDDLSKLLVTERRADFYRCLSEKLLIYALGRGLEYYDVETVDQIVDRLEREQGRFSALLLGVVESAPFQKQRNDNRQVVDATR